MNKNYGIDVSNESLILKLDSPQAALSCASPIRLERRLIMKYLLLNLVVFIVLGGVAAVS